VRRSTQEENMGSRKTKRQRIIASAIVIILVASMVLSAFAAFFQ
jgi:hypothetical protein